MYRITTAQCLVSALTICCCTALLAEDAGEVGKSPDESYGLAADIGGTCDFLATNGNNSLQQALDAANEGANAGVNNEIRVANSGNYSGQRYFINDKF